MVSRYNFRIYDPVAKEFKYFGVDYKKEFIFLNNDIMQSTGLADKHGKEIFENDIVLVKRLTVMHDMAFHKEYECLVVYYEGRLQLKNIKNCKAPNMELNTLFLNNVLSGVTTKTDCEIIGNSYER